MTEPSEDEHARVGLCVTCEHGRVIVNDRGSRFYRCERSTVDPTFPRYPRLPVMACRGYERLGEADREA